jgi:hypothetical protein
MKHACFWEDPIAMYSSLSFGEEDIEVKKQSNAIVLTI